MSVGVSGSVERLAAQAVEAAAGLLADRVREAVPGVSVAVEGDRVVVLGRGLAARMLEEPALRWPGGLA